PWRNDPEAQAAHAERIRANVAKAEHLGRWPANVVLDPEAAAMLDEQTGELTSGFMAAGTEREGIGYRGGLGNRVANDTHGDSGGASRFFYCAKTSRGERWAGVDRCTNEPTPSTTDEPTTELGSATAPSAASGSRQPSSTSTSAKRDGSS